ncbi:MAG TPA: phosphatidate cytidylyltransferase [Candidatus Omnitrophota bacterium]|jgi:phosphatidate cytidylyltransferase|nr:MAG: Phosphatidate cytidylyltransferase [Candidatus Omnitrophica bacterium ADurb.Bin314]HOE68876.1 phosphatidate cytidylyltransferase [Candidatus Omnitrophota bacterium]HPW64809.1 phosphatidate cytidylyltransferase [Candidatus Omnitrophota bacterium]HQB94551.1 phosphatidate cytidylyltransferase [Candidatus Omnitrophota bacterium]
MSALAKRIGMSFILVPMCIVVIFYAPHWVFFIVVEGFILLALNEFFSIAENKGLIIHRGFGLCFGALLPFAAYSSLQLPLVLGACVALFIFLFNRRSPDRTITSVAVSVFGIVYVAWFFSYLIKLRLLPDGAMWVFYTILIVKAGDAGAYFVGSHLGRVKLLPLVSPNKSVEGAIGQMITTVALSMAALFFIDIAWYHMLLLGLGVGGLAIFGDLAESLIKRDAGVKDSGQLPGLGGVLDVIDSLLFTVPFVYFYLSFVLGLERM